MIITKEMLTDLGACRVGIEYFESLNEKYLFKIIDRLNTYEQWSYANWLLPQIMIPENRVKYAVFAAELVLSIFEKFYPDDNRPRRAIEAAKNSQVCADAAWAAWAADAADAAAWAARAADAAAARAAGKIETIQEIVRYGLTLLN